MLNVEKEIKNKRNKNEIKNKILIIYNYLIHIYSYTKYFNIMLSYNIVLKRKLNKNLKF